ncbi:apoptotic protease-activating factor 1 isoform X1 [Strongylocentrotus purpuratus]|uniref:Death domain-containing protein n=1 Tax=Strongylocentrotus purpuratus TaxID=7668 RepID=A0A7M7T598_STRPU|nr:apoptotic protease-activating factor 1 isoform X1 [Strongylocentrotus purpuratus]
MASSSPPTRGYHADGASLSDILLMELAEHLHPNDYRPLGVRLGFNETRLSQIERSHLGVISECMYVMLTEWKRREGQDAKPQLLIQSVRESKNSEAADWLQSELGLCNPPLRTISVEDRLNEGNVPALPDCLTERPVELAELRGKLRRVASSDKPGRWVAVCGMGGMGKTILANQAVRDEKLVEELFSDGIFWMSMGNVKEENSIPDRLETLCRIFDSNLSSAPSPPKTLEQWKNLLTKLISQRYPRSLLVLDDIWIPNVVAAFDVRCTVLMTTRDSGVMSRVSGDKEELNLSHGLSKDQSIKALSEWTCIPLDNLPPEAELIHGFSCGSPLVISIVGALLRDFPDRWQFYVAQMEAKKLQDLSSDSSYEYRSVYDAIEMSVEQLTTSQIEVYSWFAVFEEGIKLSSQVLAMLVECSKEEVEDRMRGITRRSLVSTEWSTYDECRVYWIHDLLHDHLVARGAGRDKPLTICNEFRCLLTLCKFKSCRRDIIQAALHFPPSSLVYRRALRVAQETRDGFYIKESTNIQPMMTCVRHGTTGKSARRSQLLPDGKEVVSVGFEGLFQITDKYSGAVRMQISAHTDSISDLSVSPDGALLATSCTADRCVNVWNITKECSQSQRLVKRLCQDNARITCCAFVSVRKELMLVSGDDSGCLKIWDGCFSLRHSVKAHALSIITCSPCHAEGTVLTCAKRDDTAMVFSASSGERKCEINHSDDVLDAVYLSNGLIVTTTGFEVQVSNSSGRRICLWSGNTENEFYEKLSCCTGSEGHLIAVTGRGGKITVLRLGMTFLISRNLSLFCILKTGGIFRLVNHTSISSFNGEKGSKESLFLTTTHDCGLTVVWKILKQDPPVTLNHAVWDASFSHSGELNCLVATECPDSKQIMMATYSDERNCFSSCTKVLKVGEGVNINAVDISKVPGQAGVYTDEGIQVVKLPKPGKNRSKSTNDCHVFEPSENKILLARIIGNKRELLTVSTGSGISIEVWSTDKQPSVVSSSPVITSHQGLSADLSCDQANLVVGCSDGTALLFKMCDGSLGEGEPIHMQGPPSRVSRTEFSADGKLVLLAGWKHLKVYDVSTQQELSSITEEMPIAMAHFITDSSKIVTSTGTMIKVRTARDGIEKSKKKSYTQVTDIQISRDGSMMVTTGHIRTFDNGYIEWWKAEEGNLVLLQRFRLNSRTKRIICNPQFSSFVTVDELGHIFVFERINTKH